MRRLLLTLLKIVSKCPTEDERAFLTQFALFSSVQFVGEGVEPPPIKPALQALESLLAKQIITATQLLFMLKRKNSGLHAFETRDLYSDELFKISRPEWISSVEDFISSILQWAQYPDVAPTAGRMLCSLLSSMQRNPTQFEPGVCNDQTLPLWLPPIQKALRERPELLDGLETYILPGLLRLNPADTQAFLKTLPLKDLQGGVVGYHTLVDIQLCLLTARTVVELSTYHVLCMILGRYITQETRTGS